MATTVNVHEAKTLSGQVDDLVMAGFSELPVTARHAEMINSVDLPHGDPVDRLLLPQAKVDGLTFITADRAILATGRAGVLDARV